MEAVDAYSAGQGAELASWQDEEEEEEGGDQSAALLGKEFSESPALTAGTMGKAAGCHKCWCKRGNVLYFPSLNAEMCKCSPFQGGDLFIKRFVSRLKNNCS